MFSKFCFKFVLSLPLLLYNSVHIQYLPLQLAYIPSYLLLKVFYIGLSFRQIFFKPYLFLLHNLHWPRHFSMCNLHRRNSPHDFSKLFICGPFLLHHLHIRPFLYLLPHRIVVSGWWGMRCQPKIIFLHFLHWLPTTSLPVRLLYLRNYPYILVHEQNFNRCSRNSTESPNLHKIRLCISPIHPLKNL